MNLRWFRKLGYVFFILGFLLLISPLLDPQGLSDYLELTHSEQELQKNIKDLKQKMNHVQQKMERLQKDSQAEEEILHEYATGHNDETILLLPPSEDKSTIQPDSYTPRDRSEK